MVKMNRGDRMPAFLSNKVKGSVHVETPDGCNYDYDLTPYQGMASAPQPGSDLPEPQDLWRAFRCRKEDLGRMSLPQLYQPPDGPDGWQEFWFWHFQDHLQIVQRLHQIGFQLTVYDIDPWVDFNKTEILEQHQEFHNDFNGIIQAAGNDLTDVDFKNAGQLKAWDMAESIIEHQNAHRRWGYKISHRGGYSLGHQSCRQALWRGVR